MGHRALVLDQPIRAAQYPSCALVIQNPSQAIELLDCEHEFLVVVIDTQLLRRCAVADLLPRLPADTVVYLLIEDEEPGEAYHRNLGLYEDLPDHQCQIWRTGRTTFPRKLEWVLHQFEHPISDEAITRRLAERRSQPAGVRYWPGDTQWQRHLASPGQHN